MSTLASRLQATKAQIRSECLRLGREEPTLIVVTKNHPAEIVSELFSLGERHFGENRVQEGLQKSAQLRDSQPEHLANWHLIGQLQTNKVKQALQFAKTIHSVDRPSLVAELAKRTTELEIELDVFVQVNLTEDPARGGVIPERLLALADDIAKVSNLNLLGLMAVAGLEHEPEKEFETVAELSKSLVVEHPEATRLSIGMSNDYLEALQYGATHLRIGSAITGIRPQ